MEGVGLLFGKFSAMFADDKDQGRMTLSECCFCFLQQENGFQAPRSPTIQRGRKGKGSDQGSKYLPVRNVFAEKLLLINLVQKNEEW